jgi:hypothetical protein
MNGIMLYSVNKRVDPAKELPADILSAYLRNTLNVQFDECWVAPPQRTEPSLEELTDWCNQNCEHIFGMSKWAHNAARFQFYSRADLERFEQHLKSLINV